MSRESNAPRTASAVSRRRDRVAGTREDRKEAVTLAAVYEYMAVVPGDRAIHDVVVAFQGGAHLFGAALPAARGGLDVRHQQRHRAGRQEPGSGSLSHVEIIAKCKIA